MRRLRALFVFTVLFIVGFEGNAQVLHLPRTPRIKVWCSLPTARGPATNLSSREGTQANQNNIQTSSSQSGYYIEVDTATDGTHATFTVTTTADTGVGSFAKAIEDANANPGLDYINFSIGSGPQTLAPNFLFGMPLIMSPVVIDGTTQQGYAGTPIIELDGSNLGNVPGLVITAGNSTIRGLVINRCQHAAIRLVFPGGNNIIESNYIGINAAGNDSLPNQEGGIHILNSANNRIGDTTSSARNVIAGNRLPHIDIEGSGSIGNMVLGNYIGTDQSGLIDLSGPTNGVRIFDGATNNTIGGLRVGAGNLISGCDYPDIFIGGAGTSFNIVQGNRIGSGALGLTPMENGNCIRISAGASDNLIGHTTIAGRNIISCSIASYPGLVIDGAATTNNVVQGNIIGAPPSSTYFFGNGDGVFIASSPHNTIGGTSSGAANWISGNLGQGVLIGGSASTGNRIEGNLIGDPYILGGPSLLGNLGSGIFVNDAPGNIIGGRDPLAANTISANFQHGIIIRGDTATGNAVQGNFIGGQEDGVPNTSTRGNHGHGILLIASGDTIGGNALAMGNTIVYNKQSGVYDSAGARNLILNNIIHSNDSMGIDLAPHGLTPNDSLDADVGPNGLQNFPVLDSARIIPGAIIVHGRLLSTPNTSFTIEFFKNTARDRTLFGEGEGWIGKRTVVTDALGLASIDETLPFNILSTEFITATATDPEGNTSEFSRALCLKDADGDGILDCWEAQGEGIDWNADGIIDLDLNAEGAQPNHKDVFVEIDFMNPYRPASAALSQVYSAFAGVSNSFVNNPDGGNGINLHMELDANDFVATAVWASNPWPQFEIEKALHFGTPVERADPNWKNIREARKLVYRYCIFADRFPVPTANGNIFPSGFARTIPGNDFFISLGSFNPSGGTPEQQAGTFMHELGHTLGLKHGGGDEDQFKPNYYSVMNYLFQLPQSIIPGTWRLGYSVVQLPNLFEPQLNEAQGLNPPPGMFPVVKIPYIRPDGTVRLTKLKPGTAVDWDGDGDSTTIADQPVDVNHFNPNSNPATPGDGLAGYADWPNLKYNFRDSPGFSFSDHADTLVEEMTPQLYEYLLTLPPYGIESSLISWSSDPTINIPISTVTLSQNSPMVTSDGEGGAYFVWNHGQDFGPNPLSGIYAQKVDVFGAIQWMNNGIPISIGPEVLGSKDFIADREGNAIISWVVRHTGSFDIMSQKINRFGQKLWGNNGVSITSNINDPTGAIWPKMKSDGQGGAVVVWTDTHLGTRSLFAQRINTSGVAQWTPGGVLINTTPYSFYDHQIVSDGTNGVIIAWTDKRSGTVGDIYAQRVNAFGLVQWTANGVSLCNASGHQAEPLLVSDGVGDAIVAWLNYGAGGNNDIYAQHVDSSGQCTWANNGIAVTSIPGNKLEPGIAGDGSHGAILSWLDRRRNSVWGDVYTQRVDSSGVARWTANGVAISDTLNSYTPTIISDDHRGAIVVFTRSEADGGDLFTQLVDSTGSIRWARNGIPISRANGVQGASLGATITSNLAGGAIMAWEDTRDVLQNGITHIYAQNVTSSGGLGGSVTTGVNQSPTGEIPSEVSLRQNYPNPFNPTTTIRYTLPERSLVSLTIYNILGQEVATLVNGIEEPGERQIRFNASNMASGVYFYRLTTTTVGTNAPFTTVKKMMLIR